MQVLLTRLRPLAEPAVAALFFTLWVIAEAGRMSLFFGSRWNTLGWLIALGVVSVAIAVSRWKPLVALALFATLLAAQIVVWQLRFSDTGWPVYFGLLAVLACVSAHGSRFVRRAALWSAVLGSVVVAILLTAPGVGLLVEYQDPNGIPKNLTQAFATCALVGAALALGSWFLGFGYRAWMLQQFGAVRLEKTRAELRAAELDLALSTERERIAQEVHDIMAHSLSVIIAQADGARFISDERPAAVGTSLEQIAGAARASLTEVRMLIESLVTDPQGHSNPTLDDLDPLFERMREAGLALTVDHFGDPSEMTAAQQLAVVRIVQEALTNALKHSGASPAARVSLDWRGPGLAITVASSGTAVADAAVGDAAVGDAAVGDAEECRERPTGRGLFGMRERARLAGGWLTAGSDECGYIITAFIPTAALDAGESDDADAGEREGATAGQAAAVAP
ncbi:histidine kinase [Microbacterium sp. STN6]|uniref:sensor histidine kinase n=1 Tax=Microbacterium sp. STN6 TaxID=2995588 RepID=UPI002260A29E|nr:histidine kinase [Microbacterium sp. STN6]MCX7522715.1 histidine kinase [Microbacterium sp. STN6]